MSSAKRKAPPHHRLANVFLSEAEVDILTFGVEEMKVSGTLLESQEVVLEQLKEGKGLLNDKKVDQYPMVVSQVGVLCLESAILMASAHTAHRYGDDIGRHLIDGLNAKMVDAHHQLKG